MWTAKEIKQPYMIAYGASAGIGDATVRQYAEAGVNIIQMNNWGDVSEATRVSLSQIAQKYHVGILPWAFANRGLIPHWSKDPSIFGWFMWDEPGRDEPYPLSLRQQVYQETKDASSGLPMVSTWDDPYWGKNMGASMCDIVGYAVAYPFGVSNGIEDPYAFTRNRCHLYRGALGSARGAGMFVIPVLQAYIMKGSDIIPDILGQYEAYKQGFPSFSLGVYLYDPYQNIINKPKIKAYVQQLTVQLGGTIWLPETFTIQETTCPEDKSVFRVKVSSVAENNKVLACPVDGTALPLEGVEITEIVAIPLIGTLQSEIAALDERIAELQSEIGILTANIANIKETLGV